MEPGTDPPGDATALKGCLTGGLILLFFALFGERVLAASGITLPALRTAGGVLLMLIALDMMFARSSGGTTTTADERAEAAAKQDVSAFPLATPLVAGPGAISASILLVAEAQGQPVKVLIVIAAMLAVVLLTYLLLLAPAHVQKLLGVPRWSRGSWACCSRTGHSVRVRRDSSQRSAGATHRGRSDNVCYGQLQRSSGVARLSPPQAPVWARGRSEHFRLARRPAAGCHAIPPGLGRRR
jgi:MarC family membrane protein